MNSRRFSWPNCIWFTANQGRMAGYQICRDQSADSPVPCNRPDASMSLTRQCPSRVISVDSPMSAICPVSG